MPSLLQRIIRPVPADQSRAMSGYPYEWMRLIQGQMWALQGMMTQPGAKQEEIDSTFSGHVQGIYRSNGVVFACQMVRMYLFSQVRFTWQDMRNGKPGKLFGTPELSILEHPWPGGTTSDLLSRVIQDADLSGNAFIHRLSADRVRRLEPDWVTIVLGSQRDPDDPGIAIDADLLGYLYHPGGSQRGKDAIPLTRNEVAHFAPIPDPLANYRGMSWLTPIIREVQGDSAATAHKLAFFERAGTPNMVVTLDKDVVKTAIDEFAAKFRAQTEGLSNAYRTLVLGAGANLSVVGKDLQQLDFKVVQGAGETRIAAAAGVPPVIVGLSEGLQAATYSNYGQARRRLADGTMHPLWGNMAGSFEAIMPPPYTSSRLWYDAANVPFLREDRKDVAEIQGREAQTIRTLVDAGYEPESVKAAVMANDWDLLDHTGLYSVQLQPPGTVTEPIPPPGRSIAELVAPLLGD